MHPGLVYLLHAQHRYYTSELGNTHRQLAAQYNKLARVELELIQRNEKSLTRQEKKALQWTRSITKSTIRSLESQQHWLHDYLRQCNDLIASCESSLYSSPVTPWSAVLPTGPFSPVSGWATPAPWSSTPASHHDSQQQHTPQYWDLAMLRERRESSPLAPSGSSDSGYCDGSAFVQPYTPEFSNPFSTSTEPEALPAAAHLSPSSKKSSVSENDDVPDLIEPASPTRSGASPTSPHKRRYSENAIQLIESRLSLPKQTHHRRGNSASATPVLHRTLSVHTAIA